MQSSFHKIQEVHTDITIINCILPRFCNRYRFTDDSFPCGVDVEFCLAKTYLIHTFHNILHVPSLFPTRSSRRIVKVNRVYYLYLMYLPYTCRLNS